MREGKLEVRANECQTKERPALVVKNAIGVKKTAPLQAKGPAQIRPLRLEKVEAGGAKPLCSLYEMTGHDGGCGIECRGLRRLRQPCPCLLRHTANNSLALSEK